MSSVYAILNWSLFFVFWLNLSNLISFELVKSGLCSFCSEGFDWLRVNVLSICYMLSSRINGSLPKLTWLAVLCWYVGDKPFGWATDLFLLWNVCIWFSFKICNRLDLLEWGFLSIDWLALSPFLFCVKIVWDCWFFRLDPSTILTPSILSTPSIEFISFIRPWAFISFSTFVTRCMWLTMTLAHSSLSSRALNSLCYRSLLNSRCTSWSIWSPIISSMTSFFFSH